MEKVREFGLEITHTEPVFLADKQIVTMSASLAYVAIEGKQHTVSALVSEGMPIVGVGLLRKFGYTLTINFKRDKLLLKK